MNRIILALALSFACISVAGPIEDTFGVGARNKALGGAGVSIAEDYTATFYNPSLLALCRGSRLSLGYDYVHTSLGGGADAAEQLDNYNSINLGFCLKPLNQLGIGVYSNFSMGPIEFSASTLNTNPTYIMYAGDLKAFSMMMGGGYSPFRQLTVGAAMSMATGVYLGSEMDVRPGQDPAVIAKFPAQITPIVGAIVGATYIPMPELHLSLVYRSVTFGKINIAAKAKGNGTTYADALIEGFLSYSPHQIAFGSSYLLNDSWLFTGDATYYFWSKYQGPFLQIRTSPTSPSFPDFSIAGVENPNFSDVIVLRGGVEYRMLEGLKIRGGYSFRPTPAPAPSRQAKLLDSSTHRITSGIGYEFQLYQNIFLTADAFFNVDIMQDGRGSALNTGLLLGAEYD
ncbi:MAG: outer membrane protein transport protein [Myxococcota bacterium]